MKLEALNKMIEEQNEIFKNATPAEKRVIIAKDCIVRINMKQFIPEKGCLVDYENINGKGSVKKLLKNNTIRNCEVCAKGGLFMSYIGRINSFSIKDFMDSREDNYNELKSPESKKLLKIFEPEQLVLIETAFEGHQIINEDEDDDDYIDLSELIKNGQPRYYLTVFPDEKERLLHICKNIIKNKGTFVWTNRKHTTK